MAVAASRTRELVSLAKGAQYWDCSEKTLRRMIARGELTAYRLGPRLLRIDLAELDAALKPIPTAKAE